MSLVEMLGNKEKIQILKQRLPNSLDFLTRRETPAAKKINIIGHYDHETLIDKGGKLIMIFKIAGIDPSTQADIVLDTQKHRRNNLLKGFTSDYALYFWQIRNKQVTFPAGEFENSYARSVNAKYREIICKREMHVNQLYLAVITKPPEGIIYKGLNQFQQLSHKADKETKRKYLAKRRIELEQIKRKILHTLVSYKPEVLTTYKKNGLRFSRPLELISQILNGSPHAVLFETPDATRALMRNRLFFNRRSGTIEIRHADGGKKFAAVLSIKQYTPNTYAGMLDEISKLSVEYIITQSYRFYERHATKSKVRDQKKDMSQASDESSRHIDQLEQALDDAASGEVGFGAHHFSLVCFADSQAQLTDAIGHIVARFIDLDIICVREDVAAETEYWAQLPGNFSYIARKATISTKNMAALASMHNAAGGKLTGNHWGDAVTLFETLAGSPYYFNFHYKDVGNFLVYGATGSGKTVLIGFLILQSMKFGGKRLVFDKDRGLEIMVRAINGVYEIIKPGTPTGFNPCQLEDTADNRKFLSNLFARMLFPGGDPLLQSDADLIELAIEGMYRLDFSERQLCHIAPFFGAKQQNSIRHRWDEWHSNGKYAWLFDNKNDSLTFDVSVLGFDMGEILSDAMCKTPACMYLLYKCRQMMKGQRSMIFADEGFNLMNDEYFKHIINDETRTPRKKDRFLGLATQSAKDTVNSSISATINEAAACKIFFPNPSADYDTYVTHLGLSESEYDIVKRLSQDSHCFLLNYGRGKESVVLRANLEGMEDEIAVISATEKSVMLLDSLRAELGDEPSTWLPVFRQKVRQLKNADH